MSAALDASTGENVENAEIISSHTARNHAGAASF